MPNVPVVHRTSKISPKLWKLLDYWEINPRFYFKVYCGVSFANVRITSRKLHSPQKDPTTLEASFSSKISFHCRNFENTKLPETLTTADPFIPHSLRRVNTPQKQTKKKALNLHIQRSKWQKGSWPEPLHPYYKSHADSPWSRFTLPPCPRIN
jgi:hypothetical protein